MLGSFIVDFYCPKLRLAIEIDGSSHENKEDIDWERDRDVLRCNVKTIRFNNDQVEKQLENVYFDLLNQIEVREKELKMK